MAPIVELSDETVAAAVRGARDAVNLVVTAMNDRIRLMVYARLNPTAAQLDLVEDITQQAIEALLRGLPELKATTVSALRAFASTIVARRVADVLRNPAGAGRGRSAPASLDSTVAHFSTNGPLWQFLSASVTSPLSAADRADQFQRTMSELSQLREEYRTIITLAFFDQLTTAQIAERIGVSRQAAAMTLLRALRALRERLTGNAELAGDTRHGH